MIERKNITQPGQGRRSDKEIVQLLCDRDETALDSVIELYGDKVNALCKRICGNDVDVGGIVSEVFWELWRNAAKFQAERGSLLSYLLTMARSRALDCLRAAASQQRLVNRYAQIASSESEDFLRLKLPDEILIYAEEAREIHAAMEQLSRLQRQTLLLAFFEGLSHREISERMGLPLGSVKTHIRTGLLKLRNLLASIGKSETQHGQRIANETFSSP